MHQYDIALDVTLVNRTSETLQAVQLELATMGDLKLVERLQPHNLAPIRIVTERAPQLPQVACFDTAFHRMQPELAQSFALPAEITDRGVRRYGFHGLSYEYIASVLPGIDANHGSLQARRTPGFGCGG